MMKKKEKYWLGVVPKERVLLGVKGNYCQVTHGKEGPLKRMHERDWIIFYSSKLYVLTDDPCRQLTALGQITDEKIYSETISPDYIPYRRKAKYLKIHEVPLKPLISKLSFIHNKKNWGAVLRFGLIEIPKKDFELLAKEMGVRHLKVA